MQWTAKITRCGVYTYLGTYDDEFTAAIVYQVADEEYTKLGLTSRDTAEVDDASKTPAPPNSQPQPTHQCKDSSISMASRPSAYHLETLAESRLLQDKIQTMQTDLQSTSSGES